MKWCMQCGELGTPERAVGVDDEGEPACRMHLKRVPVEFNHDFIDKRLKRHYGVAELDNVDNEDVETAAPSPLQATEQEKADMGRTCSGFEKQCDQRPVVLRSPIARCTRCYAVKNYREKHPSSGAPKPKAGGLPAKSGARPKEFRLEVDLDKYAAAASDSKKSEGATSPLVTFTLPVSKVQKLIELLLQ